MRDDVNDSAGRRTSLDVRSWQLGVALGVLMVLAKLPFVLTSIGEQDQARMILSAMIYAQDGPATMRPYGLFTSPLWVVVFAGLSKFLGASTLLQFSNVLGWLASGATTLLVFLLLRLLRTSMLWAAAGAIAASWVPGAFYSSLYGYPSQFALPFLLAAAIAFLCCLEGPPERRLRCFILTGVFYAALVFLKVDFALTGTLMLSLAILRRQVFNRWTWRLAPMVAVVGGLMWIALHLLVRQRYADFVRDWNDFHPGRPDTVLADHSMTILYGCGWATLGVWGLVLLLRLLWRRQVRQVLVELLAWVVATTPLWMFWLLHPPMSTRHALPGILVTTIFAALAASRLWPRPAWVAPTWLCVILGGNALVGQPGFDINYNPSGRLFTALQVNQHAYAVGSEIGRAVAERRENVKVVYGDLRPDVLGGLDFRPMIEFALACQAKTVRCQGQYHSPTQPRQLHAMDLVFTHHDGHVTRLYTVSDFTRQRAFQADNTGFYAPWGTAGHKMRVPVVVFDPLALYREIHR